MKLKTRSDLRLISSSLKDAGRKIVTTNGVYDILHRGHLETFYRAKELGDILIVGVNSDSSVRKNKGENRPINKQKDRIYLLSALEMIDYIGVFSDKDPRKFLEAIGPDFHVKSKEGYKGIEKDVVERTGKVILLDDLAGYSTSKLIADATRSMLYE